MNGLITSFDAQLGHGDDVPNTQDAPISNEVVAETRKTLDKMLSRPILDFLVRYFVTNVNWYVCSPHR